MRLSGPGSEEELHVPGNCSSGKAHFFLVHEVAFG